MDATELAFSGIARQAELIAAGDVGARELVDLYLERIGRLNPSLNAIRVLFDERARVEADQADARRRGGDRRPLLGVPILVKDDIDVAGEVTTLGTRAYGGPARQDAELVRRLRSAGAVILGKTRTPELCIWPFTESVTYGITRNPWSLERTPGGSSGGSAAAVAAGLVGAALGSDGGGSIRIPAAWCGLFGLKPQRARVPLAPRPEAWHGLSVNGVLTRRVADTALFHDAVARGEVDDADAPPVSDRPLVEVAGADPPRLRVAVARNIMPGLYAPLQAANEAALAETAALLSSLGHEVRDTTIDYGPLAFALFSTRYLRGIHDDAMALPHPERLERRTRGMVRAGSLISPRVVARMRARERDVAARINRVLEDCDVLMTPATATPPPRVATFEGRGWIWTYVGVGRQVPYTPIWNVTGQPACSVPAGMDDEGLPRAVQLVGRPNDEVTLIALSGQLERARPWADPRPVLAA